MGLGEDVPLAQNEPLPRQSLPDGRPTQWPVESHGAPPQQSAAVAQAAWGTPQQVPDGVVKAHVLVVVSQQPPWHGWVASQAIVQSAPLQACPTEVLGTAAAQSLLVRQPH